MNIRKYAVTGTMIALMCAPALVSAETTQTSDLQGQIQTLMSQIQSLQQQLKSLLTQSGSSTKPMMGDGSHEGMMNGGEMGKMMCAMIKRNLRPGMQGDDVKSLQQTLANDSDTGFSGTPTGFFGPMTAKAVIKFQMKNGIASSSDGTVGPMTRGFFERRCGNGEGGASNTDTNGSNPKPPMGMGGDRGGMMGAAGTITAGSATSITIQGNNNESKTFVINAATTIEVVTGTSTPATTGTTADLIVGKKAMVMRAPGSGADIIAAHIRVGDLLMPPMGMGGGLGMMGGMGDHGSSTRPMPMMGGMGDNSNH